MAYLKSPMNYIGNKYRLLDQIIPILPKSNCFVDLFSGGLDVAINYSPTNCNTVYCNDVNYHLIDIYKSFQKIDYDLLITILDSKILKFGLSKTNLEGYLNFRDYYNNSDKDSLDLYLLMNYSFNYQLRFNSSHEFNNPFGKNRSSFNDSIRKRLSSFMETINNYNFSSLDFRDFDYSILQKGDLVYCDPPYSISTGSYNDGKRGFNGWCFQDDIDLINLLDDLSAKGIKFAMSNVLIHKGKTNVILTEWSKKYTVHNLDCNYNNSSYHLINTKSETREVLITNE